MNLTDFQNLPNNKLKAKTSERKSFSTAAFTVQFNNVYFSYRNNCDIFNNFNIEIPEGNIHAILGSNGCGKTTLLRLILGLLKPKKGKIEVFGGQPGTKYSDIPGPGVGYMPQDIALFPELTIKQTLHYYGLIYHLEKDFVDERVDHLTQLLNLPKSDRLVSKISSGQQRLVSIAVTMIHSPKLLILDEPTVGVDSILRCRIWQYLDDICQDYGKTVIITTHYIEEAKSASTVGFISDGKLLSHSNPGELLSKYNCITLEEVYYRLNTSDENNTNNIEIKLNKSVRIDSNLANQNSMISKKSVDFQHLTALIHKDYIRIKQNLLIIILYILLPTIQTAMFCACTGKPPQNIPIGIFNNESNVDLSQKFINKIDRKMMRISNISSIETSIDSVIRGKNWFAISFGESFSDDFMERILNPNTVTDDVIEDSEIHMYTDMSNAVIGTHIYRSLLNTYDQFIQTLSVSLGYNRYTFSMPIIVEKPVYGTIESSIAEFMGPGIMIAYLNVSTMLFSAFIKSFDIKDGKLERDLVSGITKSEILLSHILMLLIGLSIQVLVLTIFSFFVFGIQLNGYIFDAFLILFLIGSQGIGTGLLISVLSQNHIVILILVFGLSLSMWLFSPVFWPLEAMPYYIGILSKLTPLTQPIDAFRAVLLRGWTVSQSQVLTGYLNLIIYNLLEFVLVKMTFNKVF